MAPREASAFPPQLRPSEALGEGMCWLQLTRDIMETIKQNQAVALLVPKAWEKKSCQRSCREQSRSCWAVQPVAARAVHALWHSPCSLTAGLSFSIDVRVVSWDLRWFSWPPEPRLLFLVISGLCSGWCGLSCDSITPLSQASARPWALLDGPGQAATNIQCVLSPSPTSPWSSPASLWEALVDL